MHISNIIKPFPFKDILLIKGNYISNNHFFITSKVEQAFSFHKIYALWFITSLYYLFKCFSIVHPFLDLKKNKVGNFPPSAVIVNNKLALTFS